MPIRLHSLWMMLPSYPQIIDSSRAFSSHIMKYLAGVLKSHIPYVTVIRLLRASQISGFTITLQGLCEGFDWCTTSVSRHSVCSSILDTVWRIWHLWSENFMICSSAHRTVNSPSSGASMHTSKSSCRLNCVLFTGILGSLCLLLLPPITSGLLGIWVKTKIS